MIGLAISLITIPAGRGSQNTLVSLRNGAVYDQLPVKLVVNAQLSYLKISDECPLILLNSGQN